MYSKLNEGAFLRQILLARHISAAEIVLGIAFDIFFGTIAIAFAIVKRISQLLLLLLTISSSSIDFFLAWYMLFLNFYSGLNRLKSCHIHFFTYESHLYAS